MDSHLLRPIVINTVSIFRIEFVYKISNKENPPLNMSDLDYIKITINGAAVYYNTSWQEGMNVRISATSKFSIYIHELHGLLGQLSEFHKETDSYRIIKSRIEKVVNKLLMLYYKQFISSLGENTTLELKEEPKDYWKESARNYLQGMEYYRELLDKIGEAIGEEAYICDDGSRSNEVLRAKLPELVKRDADFIRKIKDLI